MKEDETGRAFCMNEGDVKFIQNFGWEARREETTWKT
jgi:hypothetical protein